LVFNLQGSEIIIILLLALVVLGPEKLPDAIKKFNQTYGELKKMGSGFQSELKSALDEPMREMRQTGDMIRDAADPSNYSDPAPAQTPPPNSAGVEVLPLTADGADTAEGADTANLADSVDPSPGPAVDGFVPVGDPGEPTDPVPDPADGTSEQAADPSDPGSETVAIAGDPPAANSTPVGISETRQDHRPTPAAGLDEITPSDEIAPNGDGSREGDVRVGDGEAGGADADDVDPPGGESANGVEPTDETATA
jgi:sec-independent protein translocase protein TatB